MIEQNENETPNDNQSSAAPEGQGAAPEQAQAAPAAEPQSELEALRAEHGALKDRLLRALAEMENLRRRTEKEVADAKAYGITSFAREAVALADNLRRALDSFPAEARTSMEAHVGALLEGVELTERDFLSRLARFGVKKIEAQGVRFDPNQHEALYEIPDETKPAGTVAQVVEPGYLIGERVLRPAKVGVTRGGPKQ
ncbi:nucleotide exchange factor GrpE [Methylocystis heyeri]|uniref:Protein GrpE n=1 Tax=Methylocystis heyeri TaxID=391905 RepID=A0A6B8KBZ0_9HYPH|nr:nucleotide exchange factor GrpE [Methylocystis heyeri]QGM44571.1 nucleotide exchange factor GrpE [Methylocystis heyeri]